MGSQNPQGEDQIKAISWRRRERALKIQEMFDRGAKVREIAQYFGISRRMVQKDLRVAERLNREMVEGVNQGELLGRKIAFLENLSRYAMRQCELSQSESSKVGWARLAKETLDVLMKIYQSTGLITTIPTRISLEEGNPFQDQEFRAKYTKLLLEARKRGLPINGL
ncbi:MAG: helix-turn-helix domain-containing protein [Thermodesulfobacteriota bacterium]